MRDFDAPSLTITQPADGQQFVDKVDLSATASDGGGVGVGRITFTYDGGKDIRNFTDGATASLLPGRAPASSASGRHTIEATGRWDRNGNTITKVVHVTKVAPGALPSTLVATARLPRKVSCTKRSCSFSGRFAPAPGARLGRRQGRRLVGVVQQGQEVPPASVAQAGRGDQARQPAVHLHGEAEEARALARRVRYLGLAPYKRQTSRYVYFRVR